MREHDDRFPAPNSCVDRSQQSPEGRARSEQLEVVAGHETHLQLRRPVVLHQVERHRRVLGDVGERLALLRRREPRDFLYTRPQDLRGATQDPPALHWRHGSPRGPGALRSLKGAVEIGRGGERQLTEHFLGGRVDHRQSAAAFALQPFTIDQQAQIVVADTPEDELRDAPSGAFIVVTTHSHALDYTLIETALARDDWRYVGLIGSRSKRAQFERRLAARGHPTDAMARVHCPIGLQGATIKAKHPGSIAVAIAAELLVVREAGVRAPAIFVASR